MKTFSATVRSGKRRGSWWTTAIPSARAWAGPWMLRLARRRARIVPLSGWWTPARILTSVLLPAPFSPTSAWTSPGSRSSETSSRAWVAANRFEIPRSSARGGAAAGAVARSRRGLVGVGSAAVAGVAVGPISRTSMPRASSASTIAVRGAARRSGRRSIWSVGQNVANAARSHFVWSTIAMTSRAAATIERLIWASSSVASARPDSRVKPGGAEERLLDVDPAEQPVAELADDRQRLPADAAAEHQHGDPRDGRRAPRRSAGRW